VKVGATHAAGLDREQDLTEAGLGAGNLRGAQGVAGGVEQHGAHGT